MVRLEEELEEERRKAEELQRMAEELEREVKFLFGFLKVEITERIDSIGGGIGRRASSGRGNAEDS